ARHDRQPSRCAETAARSAGESASSRYADSWSSGCSVIPLIGTSPGDGKFRATRSTCSTRAPLPALRDQSIPDRDPGPVDPRLHRPDLGDRDRRDLLIAEALDVAQEQRVALLDRHEDEGGLDGREGLLAGRDVRE